MSTIVTTNNLTINIENDSWSLLNGQANNAPPVVQAREDGLTYRPAFATARRLSPDGHLPADQIAMVVVGWAVEDSSWHLGIMVTPDVAQTRGGRWCGLARWPNHEADAAKEAGEALAATLHKPFRLVPPTENEQPTGGFAPVTPLEATAPMPPATLPEVEHEPPVPLMPLPISLGEWILEQDDEDLICQHSKTWRNRAMLNAVFFVVLTLIFGALSFGSHFSPFAPVQPEWLPYVGFVLTILLAALAVRQIFLILRATTVLIDNHERVIRVMRGYRNRQRKMGRTLLLSPYEGIEYVLVSHVLSRRETATEYDRIWPEVWIHLYSPRRGFIAVCYVSEVQGKMRSSDLPQSSDEDAVIRRGPRLTGKSFETRRALDLHEIDTPAHHAALHIAELIGVPAYAEGR
jgi:hypothetical protein